MRCSIFKDTGLILIQFTYSQSQNNGYKDGVKAGAKVISAVLLSTNNYIFSNVAKVEKKQNYFYDSPNS